MYVSDQRTLAEIATTLNVSEKTLWSWSKDARWQDKREALLRSRKALHEELYQMVRKLAKSIRDDIETGAEPSKTRCDLLKNLMAGIKQSREYENAVAQAQQDQDEENRQTGITPETHKRVLEEVFGVRRS
jgi:hypothetical protein